MIRLYETHHIRAVRELEGTWDFAPVSGERIKVEQQHYTHQLTVPGCWEIHPNFATYRGKGLFHRKVTVAQKTSLRIVFKGVSHTATVYWDGKEIGQHYNAYTSFDIIVRDVEPGLHELTVLVDNSFGEFSSLHVPNDYYTYGGLIRPVVIEEVPDTFIDRIVFTPIWENETWNADIRVILRNISEDTKNIELHGTLGGQSFSLGKGKLSGGTISEFGTTVTFPNVEAWSMQHPRLYELETRLLINGKETPVDDLIERVGFRRVTTEKGQLQLNGENIVLKGFNRHEDHPMVGPSFPISLMSMDIDLMVDMGANAVRTSHYPNDERFLDLCDERGILVWEENHARGFSLEQMQNPNFIWQCEQVNREMVQQHYNHPSIIIWAVLNECASDTEEGRVHYKRQLEQIRALDGSRPLTFASHHRDKERCFDLADIVSFNLYPGWYGDEDPGELCDLARGWADAAGGAGKPMIMSEFGGDGYYGYRDASRVKGTEERHADIIEVNLQAYTSRPFLSGMLIWQFCDCRVTEGTGWLLTRAGTQNSKGIVDKYRRPKLAYEVVKKFFRGTNL